MTTKLSTGLAKAILDTGSFKAAMAGMKLKIYAGSEPASADASIGAAVLLCTISDNGGAGALSWEAAAVGNTLAKLASQTWSGTNVASGTAAFFRLELASDTGAASTSEVRLQGDIGIAGKALNLSSTALASGAPQAVASFVAALPLQ